MEASISFKSIGKKINNKTALAGVSFGVEKGSRFAIFGPICSGKSTILKLISGIIFKDKGHLYVNGKDINLNPLEIKYNIGYMPQKNDFYENLSLLDNITLFGEFFNLSRLNSKNTALSLCEKLGIKDFIYNKSKDNAPSINKIAMFVRSILHNPEIILLDEPTFSLGTKYESILWEFLLEYGSSKTIIYSTNKAYEAEKYSDRVAVVSNHAMEYIGPYDSFRGSAAEYTFKNQKKDLS